MKQGLKTCCLRTPRTWSLNVTTRSVFIWAEENTVALVARTREVFWSGFWRLRSPRLSAASLAPGKALFLARRWPYSCCALPAHTDISRRPIHGSCTLMNESHPKGPTSKYHPPQWGLGFQHMNLGGDTQAFSP